MAHLKRKSRQTVLINTYYAWTHAQCVFDVHAHGTSFECNRVRPSTVSAYFDECRQSTSVRKLGMRWITALAAAVGAIMSPGHAGAEQVTWHFDNTDSIGGFSAQIEGSPAIVSSPIGKALQFDGDDDTLLIDGRPLVGAAEFTLEVMFRPDGGKFEQRFMHVAESDPLTGKNVQLAGGGDRTPRFMFEVRVIDNGWYLDTFVSSRAGSRPLVFPGKVHPLGRWYVAAQTYDGTTYRAYVDGVLQGEATVSFSPHGPGRVRLGARMNKVDFFHGAIAMARFTDRALSPREFITLESR